jgi:hypothetical protein
VVWFVGGDHPMQAQQKRTDNDKLTIVTDNRQLTTDHLHEY